jgi:hypothetical protein
MGQEKKRLHELIRIETIVRKMRELSPDLINGSYPEAFARELITRWGYGEAIFLGSLGPISKVSKDDVPPELQLGFGKYYGVVTTHRSEAVFSCRGYLQEYFENRILDAQERKGDFADGSIAS